MSIFGADEPVLLDPPSGIEGMHLRAAIISERLSEPFRMELEVLCESPLVSEQVLGHPLTVNVNLGELGARHCHGLTSEIVLVDKLGDRILYRLTVRPWLWFLSKATNCRIFQGESTPDIVKSVLADHGFTDLDFRLVDPYPAHEFLVQYRETDLNFVSRLLEDAGITYFFEHTRELHKLVLVDSAASHVPGATHPRLPYFPPDTLRNRLLAHLDRWEMRSSIQTTALALKDYDFLKPPAPLLAKIDLPAPHGLPNFEAYDYPGGYNEQAGGGTLVRRQLEEQECASSRFRGSTNCRGLCVGTLLDVSEHPVGDLNDSYMIVSTQLRVTGHDLRSASSGSEDASSCEVTAVPATRQYRPQRVAPKPVAHGAQTATVVGPEGNEIWTDEYGRVRIKFHWDRRPEKDQSSSCWVRVSQLWAGSGFGGLHTPRIGQEVIVEFLEGDPDNPVIVGRLYNRDNPLPPYSNTQSGIRSRSTKDGASRNFNEIRFDDAKGKEDFFTQAERNQTIKVKRSRSATVGGSDSVGVGGNRSVTVTGNIAIKTGDKGGEYTLDASNTVKVTAKEMITLQCGKSSIVLTPSTILLLVEGGASLIMDKTLNAQSDELGTLTLDANAMLQAGTGGTTTVKGVTTEVKGDTLVDVKGAVIKLN